MRVFSFVAIIVIAALARLIPHPANFTPMLAIALFCGAKAPKRWMACLIPVVALFLSDMILGMHNLMFTVAGALIAAAVMGEWTEMQLQTKNRNIKIGAWAGAGLIASIFFFLVTNFAVWETSNMYPHTSDGLWTCFVMGLPFFHNQVLSTWIFSGVIFGVWSLAAPRLQGVRAT